MRFEGLKVNLYPIRAHFTVSVIEKVFRKNAKLDQFFAKGVKNRRYQEINYEMFKAKTLSQVPKNQKDSEMWLNDRSRKNEIYPLIDLLTES